MTVFLFIIILAVLVLVHEIGHFVAARFVGARVDEFGLGFPPRAWSFRPKGSETIYSLNWIPFGGFVKILGENGDDAISPEDAGRSLTSKHRLAQVWVLSAGVLFNVLFAWLLIAVSFAMGVPTSITPETRGLVDTPHVMVLNTLPDSPSREAGLLPGDILLEITSEDGMPIVPMNVADVQEIVRSSAGIPLSFLYERDETTATVSITPSISDARMGVIGVSIDLVGTVELPFGAALAESARATVHLLGSVATGLGSFVVDAVRGAADYAAVAGPIGIAGLARDASGHGLAALLSFTALISLNLAIINLVPFPALDGGRILFVAIEGIIRRPLPEAFTRWANIIGFGALILLMIAITVSDVIKLFS